MKKHATSLLIALCTLPALVIGQPPTKPKPKKEATVNSAGVLFIVGAITGIFAATLTGGGKPAPKKD